MRTPFRISASLLTHTVRAAITGQEEEEGTNGSFKNRFKEPWRCGKTHNRNRRKCIKALFCFCFFNFCLDNTSGWMGVMARTWNEGWKMESSKNCARKMNAKEFKFEAAQVCSLKDCGLKSSLDGRLKQTEVSVKGVKREMRATRRFWMLLFKWKSGWKGLMFTWSRWWSCCIAHYYCGGGGGANVNMYAAVFIKNIISSCIILLFYLIFCKEDSVVLMYSLTNTNGLQESTRKFLGKLKKTPAVTWNERWNGSLFGLRWRCLDTLVFFYQGSGIDSVTGDRMQHS